MIIVKEIQTRVTFVDPTLLYSGDIETVIMDLLRQRFEGVCYMSCLILEITAITRRGNILFSQQSQDASATCSVAFRVRGMVIKKFEMVHRCVVKKIDKDGHIICKNAHASVFIRASSALQSIKEGQTIVALAGGVQYSAFKSEISVNALPFVPIINQNDGTLFTLVARPLQEAPLVKAMLEKMADEKKSIDSVAADVRDFFTDLVYPLATRDKHALGLKDPNLRVMSFKDLATLSGTVHVSTPVWADAGTFVLHKKVAAEDILGSSRIMLSNEGIVVSDNYESVMAGLIYLYVEHLMMIRQLCEAYDTMDAVRANQNLWNIYKSHRR